MGIVLSLFHFFSTPPASLDEKIHLLCDSVDSNAALAKELRGKTIHVDMTKSFEHWPNRARHCALERLRYETDRLLETVVLDPVRCKKFKKSDFALFACLWWPDAEWEDLYTAMLFTVCLFVWDDTIDTNEDTLASDFQKASVWRQQTLAYFKHHLKLSPSESQEPYCPDDVCLLFKEFGERFCANFGEVQRDRMYAKIENFVHHNEAEQAERLAGRIPTYDEYMRIRYGVTGVRMFSLLLE
ncbi:hypothetical protein N0V93_010233 [Gnomoniopsis smithogilvyi]|uniref:Terpene synthase n=1 Tax=Gnomoniopsis smithogilvyi TaxID=1191159 RepID=A0A9W8YIJ8_9PEZI|nr:hypothetical protein N0V93_010233 [Gnomoniopsis smithogilvyi]